MNSLSASFAKTIAKRRKELGLSQGELATQSGLSRNYIAMIERGQASNVSTGVLERLAVTLQTPLSSYLPGSQTESSIQSVGGDDALAIRDGANSDTETFIYLAVGLACWLEQKSPYPYPEPLQRAVNGLALMALKAGKPFPGTMTELYQLFHKPLMDWWYSSLRNLPPEINPDFPLLYEGVLDDQVNDWLESYDLSARQVLKHSLQEIEAMKDQLKIKDLVSEARRDPRHQENYIQIRRFLIEHPWTTVEDILKETRRLDVHTLLQMYESFDNFETLALHDQVLWECPYCKGILSWINDVPRCAKPSVCGEMHPDYVGRTPINPNPGILRLRWGIHTRVCIPGKTEITLFDWLRQQQERTNVITDIVVWPGGDTYDIRIVFQDGEVWAIDLKDYANPVALARQIKSKSLSIFDPTLKFNHILYVVPDYRVRLNPAYLKQLKQNLVPFPSNMDVVTVAPLRKRVLRKVAKLETD